MTDEQPTPTLQVTETFAIPLEEFSFRMVRSSGPGGQNVNKVSSKVMLRWSVLESPHMSEVVLARFRKLFGNRITSTGVFVLSSEKYRSQPRNKEECLSKLSEMLLEAATPPKPRKRTKPSQGSKLRRLEQKKRRSEVKATRKNLKPE